jgi:hypothetical protein
MKKMTSKKKGMLYPPEPIPQNKALVPVEQPVEPKPKKEKKPVVYPEIKTNDFVRLRREGTDESNIPDAEVPFWFVASDGMFLHRRSIIGRSITKQRALPKFLPKFGSEGKFWWGGGTIPPEITSQIVSFFRRIWDKHKTEAEVVLLKHHETLDWGVYIPAQKTSGAHVSSVVVPDEVPEGWQIVGSMHSHCDFSAFHSSTDEGDALKMDGVHFTVGYVDKPEVEIVAMVTMNGVKFTFDPLEIADWSALDTVEAPEEWDDKVEPTVAPVTKLSPKAQELFDKYKNRPKEDFKYGYQAPAKNYGNYTGHAWDESDDWRWEYGNDDFRHDANARYNSYLNNAEKTRRKAALNSAHWEDFMDDKLIDRIVVSNVFTDDDWDKLSSNPFMAGSMYFWQNMFLQKFSEVASILSDLGMDVTFSVKPKVATEQDAKEDVDKRIEDYFNSQLLPDDTKSNLAQRLEEEGFTVLDVVTLEDGSTVVNIDNTAIPVED